MKISYQKVKEGIRVIRCCGLDGEVEIPETIDGLLVNEIGPYAFAQEVRRKEPGEIFDWVTGEFEDEDDELPPICGNKLQSISLPSSLKKIGAYAFYGCENLERVKAFSLTADLGAGLFTGCYGIKKLDISMVLGERSCLKEMLSELRQTLTLDYRNQKGELLARLIFPEFFEESVENTPARILMREMHGCGHMYRNAFVGGEFQFMVYDRLFFHVQVEEKPLLGTLLALNRLRYPLQLGNEAKKTYEAYLASHGREIFQAAVKEQDGELLTFAAGASWCTNQCLEDMLSEAEGLGMAQFNGILMEARHRKKIEEEKKENSGKEKSLGESGGKRTRRFVL